MVQLILAAMVPALLIFAAYRVFTRGRRPKKPQRRSGGVGTAAVGTIYDMLNEDKRRAIEIIAEQKAEETDTETADGNLPELESPGRPYVVSGFSRTNAPQQPMHRTSSKISLPLSGFSRA